MNHIRFCFIILSLMTTVDIFGQMRTGEVYIKLDGKMNKEDSLLIKPTDYSVAGVKSITVFTEFRYNQYAETIEMIIKGARPEKHDVIWLAQDEILSPVKTNLRKEFNRHKINITFGKTLRKQVKNKNKYVDKIIPVSCNSSTSTIQWYSIDPEGVRVRQPGNLIYYLNNLELLLLIKINEKTSNFDVYLPDMIIANSQGSINTLKLQYHAVGPVLHFSIERNLCISETMAIGNIQKRMRELDSLDVLLTSARNNQDRPSFDQIRNNIQAKELNGFIEKYSHSKCDSTRMFMNRVNKVYRFDFDPCKSFEVRLLKDSLTNLRSSINKCHLKILEENGRSPITENSISNFKYLRDAYLDSLKYSPYKDCKEVKDILNSIKRDIRNLPGNSSKKDPLDMNDVLKYMIDLHDKKRVDCDEGDFVEYTQSIDKQLDDVKDKNWKKVNREHIKVYNDYKTRIKNMKCKKRGIN